MIKKILAKMIVHGAKKAQPSNYITILHPTECELDFDSMKRGGPTPHWILCVKAGESLRLYWNRTGTVLKAVALQANSEAGRRAAIDFMSSETIQGQSLWHWKTTFLPIEPP